MITHSDRFLGLLVLLGGTFACSDSVGPRTNWEVSFEVAPQEMSPNAHFTATLAITNASSRPRELTQVAGCISFLSVQEAPFGDPVSGTNFGCHAGVTSIEWEAAETRTWSWDLAAKTKSGEPLAPAEYHLRAKLNVPLQPPEAVFRVNGEG